MPGQTFAYLRASKLDQDLEKNKLDILKLANDAHLGHVLFISGKASWHKRQIAVILEQAQEGDAIVVSELSRLGRVCWSAWKCSPWLCRRYPYLRRQRELATQ